MEVGRLTETKRSFPDSLPARCLDRTQSHRQSFFPAGGISHKSCFQTSCGSLPQDAPGNPLPLSYLEMAKLFTARGIPARCLYRTQSRRQVSRTRRQNSRTNPGFELSCRSSPVDAAGNPIRICCLMKAKLFLARGIPASGCDRLM